MVNFKNKNVLIYGLALSGISALKQVQKLGAKVYIFDDNKQKIESAKSFNSNCQSFCCLNEENIKQMDYMIISPGVSIYNESVLLAKRLKVVVLSELELGYLLCSAPIVAVTGTNGKTTVTLMTTAMINASGLNAFSVGNVGTPICEAVNTVTYDDILVCEVSSFQLEAVYSFKPHIAALLNVTPDHINRHKTFENYYKTKLKIFENMTENDYAVLNADSKECMAVAENLKCKIIYFSTKGRVRGAYLSGDNIYYSDGHKDIFICTKSNVMLPGEHNISNALASICIAYTVGASKEGIKYALSNYTENENRIELIRTLSGVSYYNDSKGTNIAATRASLALRLRKKWA